MIMVKKGTMLVVLLLSLTLSAFSQNEEIEFKNTRLVFSLPFTNYKVVRPKYDGIEMVIVKLPEVISEKYSLRIIPNFCIIMEEVPEGMSDVNYVSIKVRDAQERPGFNKNPSQDVVILNKIDGGIDFYCECLDENNIMHGIYVLCKVNRNVGIYILFDCTLDVFDSQRKYLEYIIQSLKLTE
jgi:hypothetical protein